MHCQCGAVCRVPNHCYYGNALHRLREMVYAAVGPSLVQYDLPCILVDHLVVLLGEKGGGREGGGREGEEVK